MKLELRSTVHLVIPPKIDADLSSAANTMKEMTRLPKANKSCWIFVLNMAKSTTLCSITINRNVGPMCFPDKGRALINVPKVVLILPENDVPAEEVIFNFLRYIDFFHHFITD